MPSDAPAAPTDSLPEPGKAVARFSLGMRVAMVAVASAAMAAVFAGVVWLPLARDSAQQQAAKSLSQLADTTAAAMQQRSDPSTPIIPERLQRLLADEEVTVYFVPGNRAAPQFLPPHETRALREGGSSSGEADTASGEVIYAARSTNSGFIVLSQPTSVSRRVSGQALNEFALALAVGVCLAALIGLIMARRLTRPLRAAAEAAERLGRGDRDVELVASGPREIADVVFALSQLQIALATSERRSRDFLMSISHELRTPLTAIRGYAEALGDGVVAGEREVVRTGRVLEEEAERLDRLVADLLDLARFDAPDFVIVPTDMDFTELGQRAAQVWSDRCEKELVRFATELPAEAVLGFTDAVRVRQIIDNLAANALRVTPSGRPVVLVVRPDGDEVVVEVRDGGPGLTADDCAVAFRPAELYSRYRGVRRVGTGIGLALVGRLATRLGGHAEAGSAPEGGARLTVRVARFLPRP